MFNKMYEEIKLFIKENYKSIVFMVLLLFFFLFPVNYYITVGGGTIDVDKKVEIKNSYKTKGSLNFAYVEQLKGTIATYLLSYIMPDFKRESVEDYKISKEDNIKDIEFRDKLDLKTANSNAIKNAYILAGKTYEIKSKHFYVIYVNKKNNKVLKVKDEIIEINNTKVNSVEEINNIISKCNIDDKVNLKIKRNDKIKDIEVELYQENNKLFMGIVIEELDDYKTKPNIKLNFNDSESGPSGGLMLGLDIYNKLVKKDITNGKVIVGTGTLESDGSVGAIGGIKYKLMGAVKKKADLFIVPNEDNYDEVMEYKKDKNYKIKIIGVDSLSDALKKIEKYTK